MEAFTRLFSALDATTHTSEKVAALEAYFRAAPPADAAWASHLLSGYRLKRLVKTTLLRQWAAEVAGLPLWLIEECCKTVGDLAETLALIVPPTFQHNPSEPAPTLELETQEFVVPGAAAKRPGVPPLHLLVETRLLPLARLAESRQRDLLLATWAQLDTPQRLVWNKLITGAFRIEVSRALLVRALASIADVAPPLMEHRLMGNWQPTARDFTRLLAGEDTAREPARPYPFHLASPLEGSASALGDVRDWQIEWKWDGIRVQLIRRAGQCVLWSRGEEIVTAAFPEIAEAASALPEGTVLDGELLAWRDDQPLPFAQLEGRLNRRSAGRTVRARVPVVFMGYDLLEYDGRDWRERPLEARRRRLGQVISSVGADLAGICHPEIEPGLIQGDLFIPLPTTAASPRPLRLSPVLPTVSWTEVTVLQRSARQAGTEGVMLKRRDSTYGVGRQRGAWWKWKVEPLVCDAVLVAAQPGHGPRAKLFTDYTFAVWQDDELVPVARACSGLTDEEIQSVDAFVRENTTGRFGPVRSVKPELVFELAFDGIQESSRHKSGIALRFPRIGRRRPDKTPAAADSVASLRELLGTLR